MAVNRDGKRVGQVTGRSQFHNDTTDMWYVRDKKTGRILYTKKGDKCKGIRRE